MNAQFAVRVAVISGIALVVFAAIFFRLWYLEVLSGDEYLAQSQSNQTRTIPVLAARGKILDSDGRTLVSNRTALSLQVRLDQMPERTGPRNAILKDLARASDIPYPKIKREIRRQDEILPAANPITLADDVKPELVYYIAERQDEFPGITAGEVSVRKYPQGTMAAHLFGYVNEASPEQLDEPQYSGLDLGDRIGADGLELQYDSDLRGKNGALEVQVDANGVPRGRRISEVPPRTGNNLVLSLDSKLQKAGEQGLANLGLPGAFVAMDVNDGSVLAMGSAPTFDPSVFTPPVSPSAYSGLQSDETAPLANRAITGAYPTGSIFKPITALAALSEGVISPTTPINDSGSFDLGAGQEVTNSGGGAYGSITVQRALQVSSNVFFATLGARLETETKEGLQKWASELGIGSTTGIDLPGEGAGLLPTPEWRNDLLEQAQDPDSPGGEAARFDLGETDRGWGLGDNVNLAIGQGDLQADPMQMAVALAAIVNDGQVLRPHLASEVRDPAGRAVQDFAPAAKRELDIADDARAAIMAGMHDAATAPGGTSYELFGGYPVDVAGKTGTAERPPNGTQSWYLSFAPFGDPEIVVAVTVERGGFGAEAAAPIARDIYGAYFGVKSGQIDQVEGETTPDGTG